MDLMVKQTNYYVGVDLGQSFDPTAIVVVEHQHGYPKRDDGVHPIDKPLNRYRARHIERLPLDTDYFNQVQYVSSLMRRGAVEYNSRWYAGIKRTPWLERGQADIGFYRPC